MDIFKTALADKPPASMTEALRGPVTSFVWCHIETVREMFPWVRAATMRSILTDWADRDATARAARMPIPPETLEQLKEMTDAIIQHEVETAYCEGVKIESLN